MSEFSELDLSAYMDTIESITVEERLPMRIQVYNASGKVNYASYYICPYCCGIKTIAIGISKITGMYPFCECKFRNLCIRLPTEIVYDIHTSSDSNEIVLQGEVHEVQLSCSALSQLLHELRTQELDLDSVIEVIV